MKNGFDRVFERLEPPSGGLRDLRTRIEADRRRRLRMWRLQGAAAAALGLVVAVLGFVLASPRPAPLRNDLGPTAVRLGLVAPPVEAVVIPPHSRAAMAARQVPMDDDRVVFYLVAPLEAETEAGGTWAAGADRAPDER